MIAVSMIIMRVSQLIRISVTVKMEKAVITQSTNKLHSEIVFHCNAVLTDVIVPSSIDIDVKWFVDNKNVHSETFNAEDRVAGVLEEKHWSMGQTVKFACTTFSIFNPPLILQISCSVQAKHNIVGARTEKRRSEDLVAGLDVNQGSGTVLVKEGGGTVSIPVRSTVPVLCPPQDRAFGECCLHLELALREVEEEQLCPQGNVMDRVSVGWCSC